MIKIHKIEIIALSLFVIIFATFIVIQPFSDEMLASTRFENETSLILETEDTVLEEEEEEVETVPLGDTVIPGATGAAVTEEDPETDVIITIPVKVGSVTIESGKLSDVGNIAK